MRTRDKAASATIRGKVMKSAALASTTLTVCEDLGKDLECAFRISLQVNGGSDIN